MSSDMSVTNTMVEEAECMVYSESAYLTCAFETQIDTSASRQVQDRCGYPVLYSCYRPTRLSRHRKVETMPLFIEL